MGSGLRAHVLSDRKQTHFAFPPRIDEVCARFVQERHFGMGRRTVEVFHRASLSAVSRLYHQEPLANSSFLRQLGDIDDRSNGRRLRTHELVSRHADGLRHGAGGVARRSSRTADRRYRRGNGGLAHRG